MLSQYNFKIIYQPEAANGKADALTRQETEVLRAKEDLNLHQTLLQGHMLSDEVKDSLEIIVANPVKEDDAPLWKRVAKVNKRNSEVDVIHKEKLKENPEKKISGYVLTDCEV